MMTDNFLDREVEKLFRKGRIKIGLECLGAEAFDLPRLASGVCGREFVGGLELSYPLGAFEPFRQKMDERGIDVVDTGANFFKFLSG